jgi:hypothetical protein
MENGGWRMEDGGWRMEWRILLGYTGLRAAWVNEEEL